MSRIALVVAVVAGLALAPRPAEALTAQDIIELSRAGLGEDVLLALIEVDRGVYAIDPETLKTLKEAGVSQRVIAAMVRSGRELPPPPDPVAVEPPADAAAPQPQVVVIEHHDPPPQPVMVPVPVYVAVAPVRSHGHGIRTVDSTPFVPFQSGPLLVRPHVEQPKKPVYWGFGGKRRPDTWEPSGHHSNRDGRK